MSAFSTTIPTHHANDGNPTHKIGIGVYDLIDQATCLAQVDIDILEYETLPKMRQSLKTHFMATQLTDRQKEQFALSITEILSNLIQHPPEKSTKTCIKLYQTDHKIILDITDNSTAFLNFKEKCTESQQVLQENIFQETGRGLGIITTCHSEITYTPKTTANDQLNHFTIIENLCPSKLIDPLPTPDTISGVQNHKKPLAFIIDDDDVSRQLLMTMLNTHYRVDDFDNALVALERFPQRRPDIIISDFDMPHMNGIELRQKLSTLKGGDTTPFVFISGKAHVAKDQYINQMGIDDILNKPVEKEYLLRILGRLIVRSRQIHNSIQGDVDKHITNILTPRLPNYIAPWRMAVRTQTAKVGGGDFLLHQNTDKGLSLILSDVMGHGKSAKFFAYAYAGYLRSMFKICPDHEHPDKFLTHLSKLIAEDSFLEACIMTCQNLWLGKDGSVKTASAGHPPPLLIRDGKSRFLEAQGPLPGLSSEQIYDACAQTLKHGDRLILYTDGLIENYDPKGHNITDAKSQLQKRAENGHAHKIEKMADALWKTFLFEQKANQTPPRDDTTMVILEYNDMSKKVTPRNREE